MVFLLLELFLCGTVTQPLVPGSTRNLITCCCWRQAVSSSPYSLPLPCVVLEISNPWSPHQLLDDHSLLFVSKGCIRFFSHLVYYSSSCGNNLLTLSLHKFVYHVCKNSIVDFASVPRQTVYCLSSKRDFLVFNFETDYSTPSPNRQGELLTIL